MGIELWTMSHGQLAVGSKQWAVNSGQWPLGGGQWALDSGHWDSGKRVVNHGQAVDSGH